MDPSPAPEPRSHETAGQQFVKAIRPAGCVLFLALAVLVTWMLFTSGRDPIRGYAPPQTTEYYAAHPEELVAELEANVFPALPAYTMSAETAEGGAVVTIDEAHFVAGRAALLRYFDASLLTIESE